MKLYEIKLPTNSDFVFWVKDGHVYHHLDKANPFPYDASIINAGIISDGRILNKRPMSWTRYIFPPFAVKSEDEIRKQIEACKEYCLEIFPDEDRNIIIAHRRVDEYTVMALAGLAARTDKEVSWETTFR